MLIDFVEYEVMKHKTIITAVLLAVLLSVLGTLLFPEWNPTAITNHIIPAASSTEVKAKGFSPTPQGTYKVKETVVKVELDGMVANTQILEPEVGGGSAVVPNPVPNPVPTVEANPDPASEQEPEQESYSANKKFPAVLFIQGAGTWRYQDAFQDLAPILASSGVVTMIMDKRISVYTPNHRDYYQVERDYEKALAMLMLRNDVDPSLIGIYAESEGAWISPMLLTKEKRLAFSIMISPPVVTPRRAAIGALDNYLKNTEVPKGVFNLIPRITSLDFSAFDFSYVDFDVTHYLDQVKQPTFIAYGTNDESTPIEQGANMLLGDETNISGGDISIRYYKGADHGIRYKEAGKHPLVEEFPTDLADWIQIEANAKLAVLQNADSTADAAGTNDAEANEAGTNEANTDLQTESFASKGVDWLTPKIAGAEPHQENIIPPAASPKIIKSALSLVILLTLGILLMLISFVVYFVRKNKTKVSKPKVLRDMVLASAGTILCVCGFLFYALNIAKLATGYAQNVLISQVSWYALRVFALLILIPLASLIVKVYYSFKAGRQAIVAAALNIVGAFSILFVLSYLCIYQLQL
jgi:hypothetical protein